MCPSGKSRHVLGTVVHLQQLSKGFKDGWPFSCRGYLSDTSTLPDMAHPIHSTGYSWTETILPYQVCSAISNQRHKRYLISASENTITVEISRLMSKIDTSKGGSVVESGGRLGKLDSANESGMFHKVNKSKLEQLKKTLKVNPKEKKSTADPASKTEE